LHAYGQGVHQQAASSALQCDEGHHRHAQQQQLMQRLASEKAQQAHQANSNIGKRSNYSCNKSSSSGNSSC
jgi:predicted house-cleaning NTP pyrophosphatase (Maf/HAM1 superfamily)